MDNSSPINREFYGPASIESKKRKSKIVLFLLVSIVVGILIIFGTTKFLRTRDSAIRVSPTPTIEQFIPPTETPKPTKEESTETPTPTEKNTITPTKGTTNSIDNASGLDRSKITIQVLNGSGTGGVAGTAKAYLEGLGYIVSSTGNADNYDYEETVIQVKSTQKKYLALLEKDLSSKYSVGSTSATLTVGNTDAVVIIGKK